MGDDKKGLITIIFNGLEERVKAGITIAGLIDIKKEGDIGLIVEHNNTFVFQQNYSSLVLSENDKIEFINPDFGG